MKFRSILLFLLPMAAGETLASGFALQNQSGAGNGNAYAGAAAVAEDASTVYFNPAGMTRLPEGHSLSLGLTFLDRTVRFRDKGTARLPGIALLGSDGANPGGLSRIPVGYWSYAVSPELRLGAGVSPTFGNKSQYEDDFVGRYAGYYADLKFINYNLSAAYRVNDWLSLGGGINRVTGQVEFRQGVVVGAGQSSIYTLAGSGNAWAYNLGTQLQLAPATRLGITFRSQARFDLEGTGDVQARSITPIKAQLNLPSSYSFALSHQLDDRLELLADAGRTSWSSIQSLVVYNKHTSAFVTALGYRFKDTWRYGLGGNYKLNDAWKLRAGVALDKTPVQSPADRTMTLPDSDRKWLSVGARWTVSKAASVDFGYSRIFFSGAPTERVAATAAGNQTVLGEFKASADLYSLQYNHNF